MISKKNSISFWRIVFTLIVVLLHCGYGKGGYIAVEFFFLVSGFLLAKNIYDDNISIKEFVLKRIKRLYPMYIFALFLYIALIAALGFTTSGFGLREYINTIIEQLVGQWQNVFMLQVFDGKEITVNFAAWYVAALFWVSIIYFVLSKIFPRKVYTAFVAISVLLMGAYLFVSCGQLDLWKDYRFFVSEGIFRAYFEIGLGIIAYNVSRLLSQKDIKLKTGYVVVVELVGYIAVIITTLFTSGTRIDYALLLLLTVCVTLSFSEHREGLLCNKGNNLLSRYSYGVYLNHGVFLVLIGFYGIPVENPSRILKLLWVLPLAIICALLGEMLIKVMRKKLEGIKRESTVRALIMIVASFLWIYLLRDIKGSLLTYIIIAAISVVMSAYANTRINKKSVIVSICFISAVLSFAIVLGHYYIYPEYEGIWQYVYATGAFALGFMVFYYIFKCGYVKLKDYTFKPAKKLNIKGVWIFLGASIIYIVLSLAILILCKYPCDVMYDTMWQLDEIRTGEYTNHHSIYHTWILALFYRIGYATGIGLGNALFIYLVCQIIVVGLIAGFFIKTLYDMKSPVILTVLAYAFIILNPISIKYSAYVIKDQLHVYMSLLFIVALVRIVEKIGTTKKLDWALMTIGAIGTGILRSNGVLILVVTMLVAVISSKEIRKQLIIVSASTVAVVLLLNAPVRSLLGVKPTEFSEGLSIPIQQISRVIYDGNEIDKEDEELIYKLATKETIMEYKPEISDPVKGVIQFYQKDGYLEENKVEYLKLYLRLGFKYPGEYVKAWIDQTYGYWIPGYGETGLQFGAYSRDSNGGWNGLVDDIENDRMSIVPGLEEFLNDYSRAFENNPFLYQFIEIGGIVYLLIYMLFIKIWKRSRTAFVEAAGLATVATLIIASPLSASIRYTYLIFLLVYLSVATTFYRGKSDLEDIKKSESKEVVR